MGATFQWTGGPSGFSRNWVLGAGTSTIRTRRRCGAAEQWHDHLHGVRAAHSRPGRDEHFVLFARWRIDGRLEAVASSLTKKWHGAWIPGQQRGNTYTGDTVINAGTLISTANNGVSASSTVRLNAGATLRFDAGGQTIANLQNGSGGGGTISMSIAGTTALTVQSGSFSGILKDQNAGRFLALNKTAAGTLVLNATNTRLHRRHDGECRHAAGK